MLALAHSIVTLTRALGPLVAAADTAAVDGTWGQFLNVVAVFWGLVLAYIGWLIWRHRGRNRVAANAGHSAPTDLSADRRPVVANPFENPPTPKK